MREETSTKSGLDLPLTMFITGVCLMNIEVTAGVLFFCPTTLLAMVAPFSVRLASEKLDSVGGVAGRLYALSTLGNIAAWPLVVAKPELISLATITLPRT
jgi:hypothetical protein